MTDEIRDEETREPDRPATDRAEELVDRAAASSASRYQVPSAGSSWRLERS